MSLQFLLTQTKRLLIYEVTEVIAAVIKLSQGNFMIFINGFNHKVFRFIAYFIYICAIK